MPTAPRRSGRPSLYADARGAIREAALGLFAERGFEATSVGDIAKKAGVPKANVLYYFNGKEELWKEAVDHHWSEVDAFYAAEFPEPLPATRDGLRTAVLVYLEACWKFQPYVQIPNLEGHADTWRAQWLAEKHLRRHIDGMREFFVRLKNAGVAPDIDPVIYQTIMTGGGQLIIGQSQLWSTAGDLDLQASDFVTKYADAALALLAPEVN